MPCLVSFDGFAAGDLRGVDAMIVAQAQNFNLTDWAMKLIVPFARAGFPIRWRASSARA